MEITLLSIKNRVTHINHSILKMKSVDKKYNQNSTSCLLSYRLYNMSTINY